MHLERIQTELQWLYDLELPHRVSDFLTTDTDLARRLGGVNGDADETLFVRQSGSDTVDVSLYIDAGVLRRLEERPADAPWDATALQDWWQALEGVSHFLCVAWRASCDRHISALEMELQAEVDKFLLTASTLAASHGNPSLPSLYHTLFERTELRQGLRPELRHRYRRASQLAASYCQRLRQNHRIWPVDGELLRELRRFYRFDAGGKERHIRRLS